MILREVVHAHIPTLTELSTVRDAIDKMDIYQFPALVIVNHDHEPIAVVTEGDLCRAAIRSDGLIGLGEHAAIEYASKDPRTATVDMEISDALHKMLSSGITILPVTDAGRLAGIVLRVDLMQAMLMDAAEMSGLSE